MENIDLHMGQELTGEELRARKERAVMGWRWEHGVRKGPLGSKGGREEGATCNKIDEKTAVACPEAELAAEELQETQTKQLVGRGRRKVQKDSACWCSSRSLEGF